MNLPLAKIIHDFFQEEGFPAVSDYDLKLAIRRAYAGKLAEGAPSDTSKSVPSDTDITRAVDRLNNERVIRPDPDFERGVYQVFDVLDQSAETVCAVIDPLSYISHQSAMQRYGLSERNPAALVLTTLVESLWREECHRLDRNKWGELDLANGPHPARTRVPLPDRVRGRNILLHETKYPGAWQTLADQLSRIATIGQTFLDMLQRPAWCGGMQHVLEVWDNEAPIYLEEIITAVDHAPIKLAKVRAGYILTERLGISDSRIARWRTFAQRGSSQKLDPERPFAPTFSEQWMLSLNV